MARIESPGIEVREGQAAGAISALASDIERLVYHQSAQSLAPATVHELNRAYRVLQRAVIYYLGENHGLVYSAPDGRFRKAAK